MKEVGAPVRVILATFCFAEAFCVRVKIASSMPTPLMEEVLSTNLTSPLKCSTVFTDPFLGNVRMLPPFTLTLVNVAIEVTSTFAAISSVVLVLLPESFANFVPAA